jgi:hypothetical protein
MGALVTVLAIGTGPFIQQMVIGENRLAPSTEPATISRGQGIVAIECDHVRSTRSTGRAVYSSLFGGTTATGKSDSYINCI